MESRAKVIISEVYFRPALLPFICWQSPNLGISLRAWSAQASLQEVGDA